MHLLFRISPGGGLLYDAWWATDAAGTLDTTLIPAVDNASWTASGNTIQTGVETWHCSSCHGWDYVGADGQFSDSTNPYFTGGFGILNSTNFTSLTTSNPTATFDVIDAGMLPDGRLIPDHDFGARTNNPNVIYALTMFVESIRAESTLAYPGSDILGYPQDLIANITTLGDQADGYRNYYRATPNTVNASVNRQGGCFEGCHGSEGVSIILNPDLIDAPKTITDAAINDPFKTLHKIRFGQPGSTPAMAGLDWYDNRGINRRTSQVVALNILIYAQFGLPADHARGGRLFDNWIVETGLPNPSIPNPLLTIREPNPGDIAPEQEWLCSSCHGFDYEGVIGFKNSLVRLKIDRDWDLEYLFNYLRNGRMANVGSGIVANAHDFSQFLSDGEIWHLTEFLMEGVTDTYQYISPGFGGRGLGEGIGLDGDEHFNGLMSRIFSAPDTWACIECHSDTGDGTGAGAIITQPPAVNIFTASWMDTQSPWRFFHRTRFGMPGLYDLDGDGIANERMPGLTEIVLADRRDPTSPVSEESNLRSITNRSMDILTYAQEIFASQNPLILQNQIDK